MNTTMQKPGVDPDPAAERGPWAPGSPRTILIGIFVVQAFLSLRLYNSAYRDEALQLWVGHSELNTWFRNATQMDDTVLAHFAGSPYVYPPYGALMDGIAGLSTARLFSTILMVWATGFVYGTAKKFFHDPKIGLWAAGAFVTAQSTQFLGHFATFDPMAVFFLAAGLWLAVRDYGWVIAGPVGMLAVSA
ncbi:MAG: phospholipid carrier-dependent glycosyltransferase, partial [Streptosporangiaceae bacterium]